MKCVSCGRPLRRQGTSKLEFPGTVVVSTRGRCSMCRQRRLGIGEPPVAVPGPPRVLGEAERAVVAMTGRRAPAEFEELLGMLGIPVGAS